MEFESTNSNTTAKLPILKLEVIKNSNSWVSVPQTTQVNGTLVTKMSVLVTTEEKTNKKNDVKARSLLLMALPNEHQLTLSSGAQNLAFMTAPSTSSTNDANTASPQVSTASPNVNTASPQVSTASFSDNVVYAFMRTGKKIFINANDTTGYDKSKVECFNFHKMRHFARECRAPRSKKGFDWSDMAEEQVQTNMALMAFSDSEVYNDKTCSKICLKNYETLKKQCDDLIVKLNQTEFTAATYKRGLAIVEEQFITYRKNEVLFSEEVAVLKKEVACKDYEINVLKNLKKLDLSYSGLDEFKEPEIKGYGPENINTAKAQAVNTVRPNSAVVNAVRVNQENVVKALACWGKPQQDDTRFVDSRCSRHMTRNIAYLSDFKEFNGGYVTFSWCISQMCDKKNYVLFIDTECLVLSLNFKLLDESQILLKIPRKDNMYSFDIKNIVPKETLTCLIAKATSNESMLWHRRLGHINFKNKNKLVKDNLLEDADGISSLPNSEIFEQLALMGCLLFKERMNKGNGWWRNWLFNMKEHFNIMRRQEHLPERV
ncbi:ribonuclease H-like domain-containing protein [Tanacetum coccineum]